MRATNKLSETDRRQVASIKNYSQLCGPCSRRRQCVWTEGVDAGVVDGEIDNAADLHE